MTKHVKWLFSSCYCESSSFQNFPKLWVFPEDLLSHLSEDQRPSSQMVTIEPYRAGLPIKVKYNRVSFEFVENRKLFCRDDFLLTYRELGLDTTTGVP